MDNIDVDWKKYILDDENEVETALPIIKRLEKLGDILKDIGQNLEISDFSNSVTVEDHIKLTHIDLSIYYDISIISEKLIRVKISVSMDTMLSDKKKWRADLITKIPYSEITIERCAEETHMRCWVVYTKKIPRDSQDTDVIDGLLELVSKFLNDLKSSKLELTNVADDES